MTVVDLWLEGAPKGKGRPRMNTSTGRAFTPAATRLAEGAVVDAWINAGMPRLGDGPLGMRVTLFVARPRAHYRRNGELTATGLRETRPHRKKPDVDNAAKLLMDALEGKLYPRDVAIVELLVFREWSSDGWERTHVKVWELP